MARMARVVVPHVPHHVTQRGNRRQRVFFSPDDYRAYLTLLSGVLAASGVAVWAYCLMPNHVHLVVVPESDDSLSSLFVRRQNLSDRRCSKLRGYSAHRVCHLSCLSLVV